MASPKLFIVHCGLDEMPLEQLQDAMRTIQRRLTWYVVKQSLQLPLILESHYILKSNRLFFSR